MSLGRTVIKTLADLRLRFALWNVAAFGCAITAALTLPTATQDANANGETRSLTMFHSHTSESLTITYKRDGSFDSGALEKLNWFLRDWRVDEPTSMAPQLFDVIWYAYREVGASDPIRIMSAYRSPGTNAMLRRRSRAVAKESQHMRGNAMDIHIPGVSMAKVREIGMRLQRGGVGYYPSAGSPFVHLDVGSVRSWPRMPREQLERLFPDGKTVHLPADGIPLANYQAALAEVQARGGSALDYDTVTTNRGKSLWALLFGGDEDEDAGQPAVRGRNTRVATRGRSGQPAEQVAALSSSGDNVMSTRVSSFASQEIAPSPRAARSVPIATPAAEPIVEATPAPKQTPAGKVEPQLQIASLPVPPIRPRGAQLEKLVTASEPMPPIRPAGLTTLVASLSPPAAQTPEPTPVSPTVQASAAPVSVAGMPLPPVRPQAPVVVAATAAPVAAPQPPAPQPVNLPAPPLRPAQAVTAQSGTAPAIVSERAAPLPAIVSRPAEPAPAPAPALTQAYAAIAAPVPPSRPVARPAEPAPQASAPPAAQPVPVPATPPVARAAPKPKATNPNALLATGPEAQMRPRTVTAVAEPPVEREVKSSVVAMKFGATPTGSAAPAAGFGGAFIRPLGASFTRTGE
ncbi:MAG: hypothetical protein FD175_1850 [Beijerinckiaceae bacterium]|nr:MAG: hypothetical protein FD175_1850 [Beijerinckiaceae bacterium]